VLLLAAVAGPASQQGEGEGVGEVMLAAIPSAVRSTWSMVSSSVPLGTPSRSATSPSALRGVR
jgi:hypothetical protein